MKKAAITTVIVFALLTAAYAKSKAPSAKALNNMAEDYPNKEWHVGFECADCHGKAPLDRYYLVNSDVCLSCHGSREDVAELTSRLDVAAVNPHRSFHSGTATECYECHREHRPS